MMNLFASTLCCLLILSAGPATASKLNGFDVSNATVPASAILRGGPPRDGIPALSQPHYIAAEKAAFLQAEDRVLGIVVDGVSLAYPIKILNWHELVNDSVNGKPFLISYCPLCGTGIAFSALVKGQRLEFGVSGLLYNSDVLFYDRQQDSLWSQILGEAITGPLLGEKLRQLPLQHTSWKKWRADYPATRVLADKQGHRRDYRDDPYSGYEKSRALYFKVAHKAPRRYHTKERVLGVRLDNQTRAYPFIELHKQGKATFTDQLAGQHYIVNWDADNNSASITDLKGTPLSSTVAFWFAWYAFHPDTEIFEAGPR
ncbi:MAG: DUF3179 domain-containing protein [Pseudomonadales bacterium]